MFECMESKNVLGQMTVRINTTTEDWNRLLETGLWDKVVDVLNNTSEEGEKQTEVNKKP